ncbi:MAG: amino acid ABC transporter ATP-binding protein [Oscillospiraceae bacterium]|nr:amino acid ABC transporter ATP-binding protein [Oscillospiraceae bacterium]
MLTVNNIRKSFGSNLVLNDISLTVSKGEALAVIGPSGSGKSTLLRCINQFETIDSGEILVDGEPMVTTNSDNAPVYADKAALRKIRLKIGLVFQNFNLFPHYSVLRNLTEAPVSVLNIPKGDAEAIAYGLLDKMGLSEKAEAFPYQLSGGQQQRVSIARAMALSPEILFFDEPTSALDPELTGEVLKIIRSLADEKMTMVIVTHEMAFARDVADSVIFMDSGVVVERGSPEEVFGSAREERTRQFLERYTRG